MYFILNKHQYKNIVYIAKVNKQINNNNKAMNNSYNIPYKNNPYFLPRANLIHLSWYVHMIVFPAKFMM